jgi:dTDP-4-dehydrorhamnose reductase
MPLELWAGVECTVNRVGEHYFDQCHFSGHDQRLEDLNRFAALGIRCLRYPVLWEKNAPRTLEAPQWNESDRRLNRLRELGIRTIAGLLHHGSGPRYTSLADVHFPEKLARYAGMVAERYPWIDAYTPVNEPLTTARFSGLYGVWYPHATEDKTFIRCLLNECRGTVLAMKAIRRINPNAELVQTEDLGEVTGTPKLQYQVTFENDRRWLSFDLLTGRVNKQHPLWRYLRRHGVTEPELRWFQENTCVPNVIGINHYVTSSRHLDENLESYPTNTHGGNGLHAYADVETVRVVGMPYKGFKEFLRQTWDRYHLPIAATEVHIGAHREQQIRWFNSVWRSANELAAEGVNVRAVTAWSLLGSFDWNCLVRRCDGFYESGVFDARGPQPRQTALAGMLRSLSKTGHYSHPVLQSPGWWETPGRAHYGPQLEVNAPDIHLPATPKTSDNPILIVGKNGTLGKAFARVCESRHINYRIVARSEMELSDSGSVAQGIEKLRPWAIINAAGYVRVDEAEQDVRACFRDNVVGADILARTARERNLPFLSFSSDLVFDGQASQPYTEDSPVRPLNVYGSSKAAAERQILLFHPRALVVRTSAFFGPWDEYNFVTQTLRRLMEGQPVFAADDTVISPTYVPDLVETCLDLLIDEESGIWHLVNAGETTWKELAVRAAKAAGLNADLIEGRPMSQLSPQAKRPLFSALASERGQLLPPLETAINKYVREVGAPAANPAPVYRK